MKPGAALAGQVVDALVLELTALDDDDWSFVARLHAREQAHHRQSWSAARWMPGAAAPNWAQQPI